MALIGVVVCGAGPASDVGKLVQLLHEQHHEVRIIPTPSAVPFLDIGELETMTGRPVRSQHRKPDEPRSGEMTDAYIVAPATYNTINKLAAGISDTYALDLLNEAIGLNIPVVILPFVNSALACRRPYRKAIESIEDACVKVLGSAVGVHPHEPGSGGTEQSHFNWHLASDSLRQS